MSKYASPKIQAQPSFLALVPFFIFIILFTTPLFLFSTRISPVFACIIAVGISFFTFQKKLDLNKKIRVFLQGASQENILFICFIFIFTSSFSYVLKAIGGIDAIIRISFAIIPSSLILPGFFIVVSLCAFALGTSLGTITAFLPLGVALAEQIGASIPLMAALVLSGALLGDNLSLISDTTVAASSIVNADIFEKFKENAKLVLPAFLITIGVLTFLNINILQSMQFTPPQTPFLRDYIFLCPYLLILTLTALGLDVLLVVIGALFFTIGIGISWGNFTLLESTKFITEGFCCNEGGIVLMVVYTMCKAGLSHIVEYNQGIEYIINKTNKVLKKKSHAEGTILFTTALINTAISVAAVSILVVGSIARQIGNNFNIKPARTACLIDVSSTLCQHLLPYGAPLMLASTISKSSPFTLIPYLYYEAALFVVVILSVIQTSKQSKKLSYKPSLKSKNAPINISKEVNI
jgi:Na+/H+ antiporter NhaC